jgi:hypothetical protein
MADAVLLLGPLYHIQDQGRRIEVLRAAARVSRPGACLVAAGITRYASALDGMVREMLVDPVFQAVVDRDLATGCHDNPNDDPRYFTTAFFHEPGQLEAEARTAGWSPERTVAVEGPASLLGDVPARLADSSSQRLLLDVLRRLEEVPWLLGVSWHHLVCARKQPG